MRGGEKERRAALQRSLSMGPPLQAVESEIRRRNRRKRRKERSPLRFIDFQEGESLSRLELHRRAPVELLLALSHSPRAIATLIGFRKFHTFMSTSLKYHALRASAHIRLVFIAAPFERYPRITSSIGDLYFVLHKSL